MNSRYESDDDACRVFRKMLDRGNPPDDWDALVLAANPDEDLPSHTATRKIGASTTPVRVR